MDLPLGTGSVAVALPDCDVTVLERPGRTAVDPRTAAVDAMADPHGPDLESLADPDDEVTVVVTDVTRATPDDVLVDVLVDHLPVPRENIRIVIGLGLHRPMTEAEIREGLGDYADLAVNHDPEATVTMGEVDGHDVDAHPAVAEADLLLSTGMVEPHQYAGFSGGAKTVVIGAGSESMIRYTHGPEMLSRSGVRLGRIDGNPFRETIDRAGDVVGLDFCLNVTKGPEGVLGAAAGRPRDVVADLTAVAREALSVPVDREYDAVVAGVGAPKDANLYQTTRAATYLALGDRNPVKAGGRIVLPATLAEGAGEGTGERRFYERLRTATDAETLYEEMREGYEPGAQRAFVVARTLRMADVYVTNSDYPEVVEECLMHAAPTVADAVVPGSDVLVVPDALNTLVVSPE
ncbi:lactate racemase domain-containing protein [Haloplanus sp. GCM10025708]|uniref:lactate racemase domain-containing protein n=1 Tax=Haloferacaceae TaxID=1644056 RepID=UPI003611E2D5